MKNSVKLAILRRSSATISNAFLSLAHFMASFTSGSSSANGVGVSVIFILTASRWSDRSCVSSISYKSDIFRCNLQPQPEHLRARTDRSRGTCVEFLWREYRDWRDRLYK